jgi:hypothetical protein
MTRRHSIVGELAASGRKHPDLDTSQTCKSSFSAFRVHAGTPLRTTLGMEGAAGSDERTGLVASESSEEALHSQYAPAC